MAARDSSAALAAFAWLFDDPARTDVHPCSRELVLATRVDPGPSATAPRPRSWRRQGRSELLQGVAGVNLIQHARLARAIVLCSRIRVLKVQEEEACMQAGKKTLSLHAARAL
jgi:hypothetical protein